MYTIIQTWLLPTIADRKSIGISDLGAAIAYLIKNLLTASNGNVLGIKA